MVSLRLKVRLVLVQSKKKNEIKLINDTLNQLLNEIRNNKKEIDSLQDKIRNQKSELGNLQFRTNILQENLNKKTIILANQEKIFFFRKSN